MPAAKLISLSQSGSTVVAIIEVLWYRNDLGHVRPAPKHRKREQHRVRKRWRRLQNLFHVAFLKPRAGMSAFQLVLMNAFEKYLQEYRAFGGRTEMQRLYRTSLKA